jgi:hypothetical protein
MEARAIAPRLRPKTALLVCDSGRSRALHRRIAVSLPARKHNLGRVADEPSPTLSLDEKYEA